MQNTMTLNQLDTLLQNHDAQALTLLTASQHELDVANTIKRFDDALIMQFFVLVSPKRSVKVFNHLPSDVQVSLFRAMNHNMRFKLCLFMSPDDRADLYNRLPHKLRPDMLAAMTEDAKDDTLQLAAYPEQTVGSVMNSDCASLPEDITAGEALARLRSTANERESIYTLYVVDDSRMLKGVVSLRELFTAAPNAQVADLMQREVISIEANAQRAEAIQLIGNYDLLALPVVNGRGQLVGMVAVDDAMGMAEREESKRLARFGGAAAIGGPEIDLVNSSPLHMFRDRFLWLAVLTFFGVLTSNLVAAQEEILSEVIILAAFLAPIIDMGGNTGSQSATLVIRAMSLGQISLTMKDVWFVLRRDLPVAIALGVGVAIVESALSMLTKGIGWDIVMVIALSAMTVTVVGSLIGLLLPFIARRMGTDPATLSAPMLTSIMDLIGVMIYFSFAYLFLSDLLTGI